MNYRFNIVNLIKPDSLYNHGMKPLMYSKRDAETKGLGWTRTGFDIKYVVSKKRALTQATQYFQLSFAIEFNHEQD